MNESRQKYSRTIKNFNKDNGVQDLEEHIPIQKAIQSLLEDTRIKELLKRANEFHLQDTVG